MGPADRQDEPTFSRIQITGADELLVDIALDATPGHPPVTSIAGPTLAPSELAGRKVVALFDRAAARDFVDVFTLNSSFGKIELLRLAAEVDAGFDLRVFGDMIDMLVDTPIAIYPSALSTRWQSANSSLTGPIKSEPARRRKEDLSRLPGVAVAFADREVAAPKPPLVGQRVAEFAHTVDI